MDADYIIVGAGTAGCALANRLSRRGRVLLIEAGGSDNYHWVHIPVGYLYCIDNPRTDWGYHTAPGPGINGRSLIYPRGKVLGGCSSINGMIYMRGQAADYDGWRQMGLPGWGWDDVLPCFKRSEDYVDGASEHHGAGGEWRVENQRLHWPVLDSFLEAAVQAGLPRTDDFNTGDNEGVGYFRVNQRNGWRWNTAKAFLRPAKDRVRVETKALTERVLFEGKRAVGIRVRQHGVTRDFRATREVILCAGSIGSPQILQLSGVGPAEHLRGLGIEVVHDAPQVGENLQDHLQVRCAYRVSGAKTLNTLSAGLWGKAKIAAEYALFRSGPMSMAPSQLGAFMRSGPEMATPDLQYHVQPLSLDAFGQPLHAFDAITASVCNLRPESRGHVRVLSSDPNQAPEIQPNYLSAERDRMVAAKAIRATRNILAKPAMARHAPQEFHPDPGLTTDAQLAEAAGNIASTIFHPVGTVRMGADDAAPLDATLKMRGIAGLRVVDASVMPRITSGNTNAPTLMIAEKAADLILADL
ncbi:GMC family oxidoreductase [Candidatus Rhodobacter oscarellae]|uniref:GMC family oxidoreductase n=1 Tax=Candidatus Rhodobacter oscarellae TaxID=1675527 RepID=UPI000AAF797D|nr:GMC family oxidoreductase N-terminal domain-containing protein [Candidatus Rhodobacter lobularis]